MNTKILIGALAGFGVFAALPGGCGQIRSPVPTSVNDVANVANQGVKAAEKQKKCEELGKMQVAFEEEKAIGGAVAVQWVSNGGGLRLTVPNKPVAEMRDPKALSLEKTPQNELNRYLNLVGKNLAAQSDRPALAWTFGVLESAEKNAFSAPGGYVLVTRGLLADVKNEATLAGILAHEIGHVTEKHALNEYRKVKAGMCTNAVAAGFAANVEPGKSILRSMDGLLSGSTGGFLDLNKLENIEVLSEMASSVSEHIAKGGFAKEDEFQADEVSLNLMVSAGYNPDEFIKFVTAVKGGTFSNHPEGKDRAAALQAKLKEFGKDGLSATPAEIKKYPVVALKGELAAAK